MSGIMKGLGKIIPVVLGVAAVVFTAGAALPALGAMIGVGAGGFGAAVGGVVSDLGLTGVLGDVVAGAVTSAGFGALTGGALAGVTGGNILDGATSGAETGALTGGLLGGLGVTSYASGAGIGNAPAGTVQAPTMDTSIAPGSISAATPDMSASQGVAGAADPSTAVAQGTAPITSGTPLGAGGVASSGAGGSTVQTATSAAPTPVAASSAVDTGASSGAAGNTGTSTDYTMGGGAPSNYTLSDASSVPTPPNTAPINATGTAPPTSPASGPIPDVKIPGQVYNGADGVKYTSNGSSWVAQSGGLTSSLFGNGGILGNGGLGYAISGVGQGLLAGQTAADTAGYAATAAKTAVDVTQGNYGVKSDANGNQVSGTTTGGLLTQGTAPTGLRSPAQAFNPTARWVYDPTSKALVLVNPSTPAA